MLDYTTVGKSFRLSSGVYWDTPRTLGFSTDLYSVLHTPYYLPGDPIRHAIQQLEWLSPIVNPKTLTSCESQEDNLSLQGVHPHGDGLWAFPGLYRSDELFSWIRTQFGQARDGSLENFDNPITHMNLRGSVVDGCRMDFPDYYLDTSPRYHVIGRRTVGDNTYPYFYGNLGFSDTAFILGVQGCIEAKKTIAKGDHIVQNDMELFTPLSWEYSTYDDLSLKDVWYKMRYQYYPSIDHKTPYLLFKEVYYYIHFTWIRYDTIHYSGPPYDRFLYDVYSPTLFVGIRGTKWYCRNDGEDPSIYTASFTPSIAGSFDLTYTASQLYSWSRCEIRSENFREFVGLDDDDAYCIRSQKSFLNFSRFSKSIQRDAYPVAAMAQYKALDDLSLRDTNLIETLVELEDFLALLDFRDMLVKFLKRGFSIRRILSILSSAKLLYSFGIAPNVGYAEEVVSKYRFILPKITSITRPFWLKGSYTYYPGSNEVSEFQGLKLVGHAKICLSTPLDVVLPIFLSLDEMGLLPNLSRVWDCLPFSFFVDWFFNVSSKLEVIDNTARLCMYNIYAATLSTKILYEFSEEDCESYNFSCDDETGYSYYCRYTLKNLQPFTPTRFNILAGRGIPDFSLFGSLLYKLHP